MHICVRKKKNIPALAAVPAVGTAVDYEFFTVKGSGPVSAIPCFHCDFDTIDKIAHGTLFSVSSSWNGLERESVRPGR